MPLRTVALLARQPGVLILTDALLGNRDIDPLAVLTHAKLPNAEGGGLRPEVFEFERICTSASVPLHLLDHPEAKNIEPYLPESFDMLLVCNWRSMVSQTALDHARYRVNVHRGALPEFKGAEPVRRALEAGKEQVAITAHHMTAELDDGPIIAQVWIDVRMPAESESNGIAEHTVTVRNRLQPLYAPLTRLAIASLLA